MIIHHPIIIISHGEPNNLNNLVTPIIIQTQTHLNLLLHHHPLVTNKHEY